MGFIITGQSAIECMRLLRNCKDDVNWMEAERVGHPSRVLESITTPTAEAVNNALSSSILHGLSKPVHLLVGSSKKRLSNGAAVCHLHRSGLPYGSLVKLGKGLYCESPELMFARQAAILSMPKLVEYGHELCGPYMLAEDSEDGYLKCKARSNAKALSKFLVQMSGAKGIKQARSAVDFVHDNSWSPMESVVSTLFALPIRYGGYGIEGFDLNVPIRTDSVERDLDPAHRPRYCDLFLDKAKVDVEYDGEKWHQGPEGSVPEVGVTPRILFAF